MKNKIGFWAMSDFVEYPTLIYYFNGEEWEFCTKKGWVNIYPINPMTLWYYSYFLGE